MWYDQVKATGLYLRTDKDRANVWAIRHWTLNFVRFQQQQWDVFVVVVFRDVEFDLMTTDMVTVR